MIKGSPPPKMETNGHGRTHTHLAEFPLEEILDVRTFEPSGKKSKKETFKTPDGTEYKVNTSSLRYHVFAQSSICECCGLQGKRMLLDLPPGAITPHFNLYGEDGNELILMTKDHKIPKSKGGSDNLDNFQTLCTRCNNAKGDKFLSIKELRELEIVKEYMV